VSAHAELQISHYKSTPKTVNFGGYSWHSWKTAKMRIKTAELCSYQFKAFESAI